MRTRLALGLALGILTGFAQQNADPNIVPRVRGKIPDSAETATDRPANIRVDTSLVLIPVTVTDPDGKFVTGLDKDNFRLLEDKIEQQVLTFSSEDAPMSIGLVFDTSGSMGSKLVTARRAVTEFMKTANPVDEFFLINFSERPQLAVPFTPLTEEIQNRLMFVQSKGRTALLDGVYMAMNEMKRRARNPRRAILIISDGGDNSSRYTEGEVKDAVREADVQIYGIGIFESMANRGRTPEELGGPDLLHELASLTAGTSFVVDNLNELPDVAIKIAVELRNQYVLGYTSKNKARDGKYRRVQVKMAKVKGLPPLKAAFRTGYYAPAQ